MNYEQQLSRGALRDILENRPVETPVLQVLAHKNVATDSNARYRFLLSDGAYTYQCCLTAGTTTDQINAGLLDKFTLFELTRFACNPVQNKPVIFLIEVKPIVRGEIIGRKLGNPTAFAPPPTVDIHQDAGANGANSGGGALSSFSNSAPMKQLNEPSSGQNSSINSPRKFNGEKRAKVEGGGYVSKVRPSGQSSSASGGGILFSNQAIPIKTINPYQQRWVIKGRVIAKSAIRTWSNAKGEGKLFSFDVQDESGAIKMTAFKAEADKFFDMIQMGDVYLISRGQVKPANKKFSTLNHDFEITLSQDTVIEPASDDEGCPEIKYNFVPIAEIERLPAEALIDIAGVVCSVEDLQTLTSKTNNRELKKRDLHVVDRSNAQIRVTLWGQQAVDFELHDNMVMIARQLRISDFGGRSLTTSSASSILFDPDQMDAVYVLKGWYDRCKDTLEARNLSGGGQGAGRASGPFGHLEQLTEENVSNGLNQLIVNATIIQTGKANSYKGCSVKDCKKKVVDLNNGFYRCDKCDKELPSFTYRVILNAGISDHTGTTWATFFHENLEEILQVNFNEGICNDDRTDEFNSIISTLNYKRFSMLLRPRIDSYNDQTRVKSSASHVTKTDFIQYGRQLLAKLKEQPF